MQKSCEIFLHENFTKDWDTVIEQSILQNHTKITFLHEVYENEANYGIVLCMCECVDTTWHKALID